MNESELLDQISRKLSALLAVSFMKGVSEMTTAGGEKFLRRFGLDNQEIASILGTTKRSIEVIKSRNKRNDK